MTLLHGGESCRPDGQPGQLERAEDVLASHPSTVLVTIDIGDNDLEACINRDTGAVEHARACSAARRRVRKNLPQIARRLRAAAPRSARVIGLVDYDQFLSLWLQGAQGRAAARRSLGIIRRPERVRQRDLSRRGRRGRRREHALLDRGHDDAPHAARATAPCR